MARTPEPRHPSNETPWDGTDKAIEDSFPASDPRADGGTTPLESSTDDDAFDEDSGGART